MAKEKDIVKKIKDLIASQPFFVLCTSGKAGPYGSLIAYSHSHDFKTFYFATSKKTKKYRILRQNPKVAAVLDNRDSGKSFKGLDALTLSGTAEEIYRDSYLDPGITSLKRRHKYLSVFLDDEDTVIFCIKDIRIYYVLDINTVFEWVPL